MFTFSSWETTFCTSRERSKGLSRLPSGWLGARSTGWEVAREGEERICAPPALGAGSALGLVRVENRARSPKTAPTTTTTQPARASSTLPQRMESKSMRFFLYTRRLSLFLLSGIQKTCLSLQTEWAVKRATLHTI